MEINFLTGIFSTSEPTSKTALVKSIPPKPKRTIAEKIPNKAIMSV